VLGYDLVNEPLPGDYYADSDLLLPGRGDAALLQPLYGLLHQTIREVDPDTILFYEPTPFPDTIPEAVPVLGGVHPVGFTAGPANDSARQALSFHVYSCGFANTACDADGDPAAADCASCDKLVTTSLRQRAADVARLGGGGFLTEFGAVANTPAGIAEIDRVAAQADAGLLSWAYWQLKYYTDITTVSGPKEGLFEANGTVQAAKLAALSRTYAPAVAGTPTAMRFEPSSGAFRLAYTTHGAAAATRQLATEIYLNVPLHYAAGFQYDLINATNGSVAPDADGTFKVYAAGGSAAADVEVGVAIVRASTGRRSGTIRSKDGDLIQWELLDAVGDDPAGFSFHSDGNLTWWKMIRVAKDGAAKGEHACVMEEQGADHAPKQCLLAGLQRHQYLFDYSIELWKAKALGVHTYIQTLDAKVRAVAQQDAEVHLDRRRRRLGILQIGVQ
jgi:hypothetical protein